MSSPTVSRALKSLLQPEAVTTRALFMHAALTALAGRLDWTPERIAASAVAIADAAVKEFEK